MFRQYEGEDPSGAYYKKRDFYCILCVVKVSLFLYYRKVRLYESFCDTKRSVEKCTGSVPTKRGFANETRICSLKRAIYEASVRRTAFKRMPRYGKIIAAEGKR